MSSQQLSSLLRSGTGLVEVIILVFTVIYFPLTIKTDLVTTEATIQPKTEIANNSNTCGDRNRDDGIFDCNI